MGNGSSSLVTGGLRAAGTGNCWALYITVLSADLPCVAAARNAAVSDGSLAGRGAGVGAEVGAGVGAGVETGDCAGVGAGADLGASAGLGLDGASPAAHEFVGGPRAIIHHVVKAQ